MAFSLITLVQDALDNKSGRTSGKPTDRDTALKYFRAFLNYCVYMGQNMEQVLDGSVTVESFKAYMKAFDLEKATSEIQKQGFSREDITEMGDKVGVKYRRKIFEVEKLANIAAVEALVEQVVNDAEGSKMDSAAGVGLVESKTDPVPTEVANFTDPVFAPVINFDGVVESAVPCAESTVFASLELGASVGVLHNERHEFLMRTSDFYFALQVAKKDLASLKDGAQKKQIYEGLQILIAKICYEPKAEKQLEVVRAVNKMLSDHRDLFSGVLGSFAGLITRLIKLDATLIEYSLKKRSFWQTWCQGDTIKAKKDAVQALQQDDTTLLFKLIVGSLDGAKHGVSVLSSLPEETLKRARSGFWTHEFRDDEAEMTEIGKRVAEFFYERVGKEPCPLDDSLNQKLMGFNASSAGISISDEASLWSCVK